MTTKPNERFTDSNSANLAPSLTSKVGNGLHPCPCSPRCEQLETGEALPCSGNDRLKVLLRAARDILRKCNDSHYVLNAMEVTAFYDGTDCDGSCLMEDIECELGIDGEEDVLI